MVRDKDRPILRQGGGTKFDRVPPNAMLVAPVDNDPLEMSLETEPHATDVRRMFVSVLSGSVDGLPVRPGRPGGPDVHRDSAGILPGGHLRPHPPVSPASPALTCRAALQFQLIPKYCLWVTLFIPN
jgi:hypothetical protein